MRVLLALINRKTRLKKIEIIVLTYYLILVPLLIIRAIVKIEIVVIIIVIVIFIVIIGVKLVVLLIETRLLLVGIKRFISIYITSELPIKQPPKTL